MAYDQWVVIHIINSFKSGNIKVQNAKLDWGRFHKNGDKDEELSASVINSIVITPDATVDISSCGREDAFSGTEGSLDLYEDSKKICTVYWNCPCASGSKSNNFQIQDRDAEEYMVSVAPWNTNSEALGNVEVEVAKKGIDEQDSSRSGDFGYYVKMKSLI